MEVNFKIYSFVKNNLVMEFLTDTNGTHGTLQSVRWPGKPIILSIGNSEGPAEVELDSM